jgi:hypothetical protein
MAFLFTSASSQYLIGTPAAVTLEPMTFSCWFYPTTISANQALMAVNHPTAQGRYQMIVNPSGNLVVQRVDNTGANVGATSAATMGAGSWHHCVGVVPETGSAIKIYLNGVETTGATNLGASLTIGTPLMLIGARASSGSIGLFANGSIAEAALHNAVLTPDEIAGLAKGFRCRIIRPQSLRFDLRMIRGLQDLSRALAMTNTNGATVSDHPRIIYP